MPLRYDDVTTIAHDIEHFSSLKVAVIPGDEDEEPDADFQGPNLEYGLPPISVGPAAPHLDAAAACCRGSRTRGSTATSR